MKTDDVALRELCVRSYTIQVEPKFRVITDGNLDQTPSSWRGPAAATPGRRINRAPNLCRELVEHSSHWIRLEEGELVRQALLKLPEIYRTVLVLRHYEGMKLARIAEVLGIPEGTVNSRMAEALNRLSRLLEPQFKHAWAPLPERNPLTMPRESFVL